MFYYRTEQERIVKELQAKRDISLIFKLFLLTDKLEGCKFLFFEKSSGTYMPMPSYQFGDLSAIGIYGSNHVKYLDKKQAMAISRNENKLVNYNVCIDFDSNVLGKMPRIFESKNTHMDQNVISFLRELLKQEYLQGRKVDFTCKPYIMENCMHLDDPNRMRGVKKCLNAFFTYMSFNSVVDFDNYFIVEGNYPSKEVKMETDNTIKIMQEAKGLDETKEYLFSQKPAQILLLQMAIIQFTSHKGSSAKQKITRLLEFWVSELGIFTERELAIAILYFKRDKRTIKFFGCFTRENKEILKDIRGMSWDLCHARELERYIFESDYENIDFENHLLATSDKGLKEILSAFPVASFSYTSQKELGVRFSKDLRKLFVENGVEQYWEKRSPKARMRIFRKTDLDYLIYEKEKELTTLIKVENKLPRQLKRC